MMNLSLEGSPRGCPFCICLSLLDAKWTIDCGWSNCTGCVAVCCAVVRDVLFDLVQKAA